MRAPEWRLAGLWPWLLMAALQVSLGHTGLELAAAVESERSAPRAVIKVTLLRQDPSGRPITLEGVFAGGSAGYAEGKLMQSHPLSLCNSSEDERPESIFISIVKLENPDSKVPQCQPLLDKARLALHRGAEAVIFDVSDNTDAAQELRDSGSLPRPVVLVTASDAEELMSLVNRNEEAMVHIDILMETSTWPHYDVGIMLTLALAMLAIVMIFALRFRCRTSRTWDSVHQQTLHAISRLETRTFSSGPRGPPASSSSSSSGPVCAVCLEEFLDGQELRIISCCHEFHKECVDPWLLQHQTCPLCLHNITGKHGGSEPLSRHSQTNRAAAPRPVQEPHQPFLLPHHHHHHHHHPAPFSHGPQRYPALPAHAATHHCFPSRPLGASCVYHPEVSQSRVRPGTRNGRAHYPGPRRTCHQCASRAFPSKLLPQHAHRQDEGSCSGGSYHTERSGYLGSDSSSGSCNASSSDSVLNCTDISLQGVYGSCSTFRSSLSSDYDPLVYYGPGGGRDDAAQRPRSLDSAVSRGGTCADEPQQVAVLSHVHYHRHRHHYYKDGELGHGRGSDEDQAARTSALCNRDPNRQPSCPCPKSDKHSPDPGPSDSGTSCRHKTPRIWHPGPSPVVHFHQNLDHQDDCSIHIHYGPEAGGYCCPPLSDPAPALLPLVLDSTGVGEWGCCRGTVWHDQQAQSQPPGLPGCSSVCPARHRPGTKLHNSQGSEEESGV